MAKILKSQNPIYFSQGVILTIYLKGVLGAPQPKAGIVGTVNVPFKSRIVKGKVEYYDYHDVPAYGHNDREVKPCFKKLVISPISLQSYTEGAPSTGKKYDKKAWAKLSPDERIMAHLRLFDAGYGISFELM